MQTTYNNVPAADAASNTDAGATDKSRSSLSPQEQAESSNAKNRVSRPPPCRSFQIWNLRLRQRGIWVHSFAAPGRLQRFQEGTVSTP